MSSLPLPIAAFFAGLISFLSPCVLPLVPGYVSLISGAGVEELRQQDSKLMRSVMLNSVMFILGFSLVFMVLGAVASSIGQATRQHLALLRVYSLGLAVPFLLTSIGIDRFLEFYGRFRRHLHAVEVLSGVLLIAIGALVFTRHFTLINAWMNRIPFFRTMAEKFL